MRLQFIPLIVVIILNIGVDIYIRRQLHGVLRRIHDVASVVLLCVILTVLFMPVRSASPGLVVVAMWMLFTYLSVYVAKYVYCLLSFLSFIPRLWKGKRWKWLDITGGLVAVFTFAVLWWGALINRFDIKVNRIEVPIADLPEQFDGFTIAQISDLHVGTLGNDTTFMSALVDSVNGLRPDLIAFTGDIVNSRAAELMPQTAPLSRLSAPFGVYSIMGNHDYGDYCDWPSDESKQENIQQLHELQKNMGWKMLNNATDYIERDSALIALIGVENIGDPPFKIYGSLEKAYPTPGDSITKILLSHNPAHWVNDISDDPEINIALTLAGHTHAMQVEIAGHSPAVLRYPTWGGLYESDKTSNKLYVNIGAGTVGIPARIGADPEVTLITLKRLPN